MRTLGKYEILEEVGQGGMSVVYRGRDTVLGREVAIKVMHPFMAQKSDAKQRFYREAMAVAKLSHPNILEIYDYSGEDEKQAYIVMEFIRGETLSSFASRVPMDLPEIGMLVIRALATALMHAHEQGIIHRDLKPENVMIRGDGRLKLMDFGIAQMIDADTLTTTGALLGSPAHMSPELIEGETCDVRSDIFSLGTILYWLMTRRLPFSAPTAPALFKRIVEGQFDDPRLHNSLITNGMMRVLMKLMKKKRDERYPTVRAFITDIDQELEKSGISHPEDALRRFLSEPEAYQDELKKNLRQMLQTEGDAAAARSQWAPALAAYDRLLALDPDDATLREKVLAIGRRQRRQRRLKRALRITELSAAGLVLSAAFALLGWQGYRSFLAPDEAEPIALPAAAPPPAFRLERVIAKHVSLAADAAIPAQPKDSTSLVKEAAVDRDVEIILPQAGSLFIDGNLAVAELQGPTQQVLRSGKHRLRAESPFREPFEREVEIPAAGDIAPIRLPLERFRPAYLRVIAETGAQVVIDGAARGPVGDQPFSIAMPRGERAVELRVAVPGKPDVVTQVTVRAGQTTTQDTRR